MLVQKKINYVLELNQDELSILGSIMRAAQKQCWGDNDNENATTEFIDRFLETVKI